MKPQVYLETTIPSYLAARPSKNVMVLAKQMSTREWWDTRRHDFELFVSGYVLEECGRGDSVAAADRLNLLQDVNLLEPIPELDDLIDELVDFVPFPPDAESDAAHLASAVAGGMNYLLTWNCTHLANAVLFDRFATVCRDFGFEPPVICTPEQLMKEFDRG